MATFTEPHAMDNTSFLVSCAPDRSVCFDAKLSEAFAPSAPRRRWRLLLSSRFGSTYHCPERLRSLHLLRRRTIYRQWTQDCLTWVSLVVLAAAAGVLPPPVSAVLLASELAFFGVSSVRYNRNSRSRVPPRPLQDGLRLLAKVLDPTEGHLGLLQGSAFLSGWFRGTAASELGLTNLTDFLAYFVCNAPPLSTTTTTEAAASSPNWLPFQLPSFGWSATVDMGVGSASTAADGAAAVSDDTAVHATAGEECMAALRAAAAKFASALGMPVRLPGVDPTAHNPTATFIAHLHEPLTCSYRPLVFYLFMEVVAAASHIRLSRDGFRLSESTPTASYYVKPAAHTASASSTPSAHHNVHPTAASPTASASPTSVTTATAPADTASSASIAPAAAHMCSPPTPPPLGLTSPIVFLHGIGAGLAPYCGFLHRMSIAAGPARPVIAVQYKHVSMRLTLHIPSADEVADDVVRFLDASGMKTATIVAHSYGTMVAASLVKRYPGRFDTLTLIDPVCFAMFLPHLIRSALYAHTLPQDSSEPWSAKRLLKGLVVRDLHCAVAMCRRSGWGEVNLWPSELLPGSTVVLSGKDNLVPVPEVQHLLDTYAANTPSGSSHTVLHHPERGHGGFLLDLAWQAEVIAAATKTPVPAIDTASSTPMPLPMVIPALSPSALVPTSVRASTDSVQAHSLPSTPCPSPTATRVASGRGRRSRQSQQQQQQSSVPVFAAANAEHTPRMQHRRQMLAAAAVAAAFVRPRIGLGAASIRIRSRLGVVW